jgi:hypothetical protein
MFWLFAAMLELVVSLAVNESKLVKGKRKSFTVYLCCCSWSLNLLLQCEVRRQSAGAVRRCDRNRSLLRVVQNLLLTTSSASSPTGASRPLEHSRNAFFQVFFAWSDIACEAQVRIRSLLLWKLWRVSWIQEKGVSNLQMHHFQLLFLPLSDF